MVAVVTPARLALLSDKEKELLRATDPSALAELTQEDELDALHKRVRRARTKYVTNYRRAASGEVVKKKARGKAQPNSERTLQKAEIFEEALARVSRRVAAVADKTAGELRRTRLAAARAARTAAAAAQQTAQAATGPVSDAPARRAVRRTPTGSPGMHVARTKKVAATRSTGAARQAKRDSR